MVVFDSLGKPYPVMDNGDDLRVCVWVHKTIVEQHQSHSQTAAWLKNMIADQMILYGHKVKVSETYCSENLVAYSQIYIMNEASMPSTYKRIIKIHGLANTRVDQ